MLKCGSGLAASPPGREKRGFCRTHATRVAMRAWANAAVYLMGDHLGSTSVAVDEQGAPVGGSPQLYKAWGETRTGSVPTKYQYTGQYKDSYINLYWYGSRWYDPELSRWIQPDSIVPKLSNSQDWDRYAYVNNSPIKYNDPTGHMLSDGCTIGGCSAAQGEEYRDYVYNEIYSSVDRQQNAAIVEAVMVPVAETVLSTVDPIDWAITLDNCINDQCGFLEVAFTLTPILPGRLGKIIDKVVEAATGQLHHMFSKKIMDALGEHKILAGIFKRDSLIVRALDKINHIGYQKWHILYDDKVVKWLEDNPLAAKEEFLRFLKSVYETSDMEKRFPEAIDILDKFVEQTANSKLGR